MGQGPLDFRLSEARRIGVAMPGSRPAPGGSGVPQAAAWGVPLHRAAARYFEIIQHGPGAPLGGGPLRLGVFRVSPGGVSVTSVGAFLLRAKKGGFLTPLPQGGRGGYPPTLGLGPPGVCFRYFADTTPLSRGVGPHALPDLTTIGF